jgi:hypothetical protein
MSQSEDLGRVKNLLENSYKKPEAQKREINGFFRDDSLSGQRAQVYHNPDTGKTYVTHRGTSSIQDVGTDIKLLFGNKTGERFKYAKDIQKKAEEKYGKENITTAGHSLGASIAERLGKKSANVVTFNKPVVPSDIFKKIPKTQLDVKTRNDPVSILRRFQRGRRQKVIGETNVDPLTAHKLISFNKL